MAMIKMIKTVRLRYLLSCPENKTTTAINAGPTYGRGGGGHRGEGPHPNVLPTATMATMLNIVR